MVSRVIFGTGKTGGHLFPAITIGERLSSVGFKSLFLIEGTPMEREVLARRHLDFTAIDSAPFPGVSLKSIPAFIMKNSRGFIRAMIRCIIKRPSFILVTGGYTSFPVGLAALMSFIPLFIFEGNTKMGKSNTLLSIFARCSFGPEKSGMGNFLRAGNPVRDEMISSNSEPSGSRKVLVTGGSQGALIILKTIYEMVSSYGTVLREMGITFTLATGHRKTSWIDKFRGSDLVKAVPFIHDMPSAIKAADLVICRSGAMTVEENLAMGRFGIYIPFARATGDHQYFNAIRAKEAGAGEVIREEALTAEVLFQKISEIMSEDSAVSEGGRKARGLFEARHKIDIVQEILRRL